MVKYIPLFFSLWMAVTACSPPGILLQPFLETESVLSKGDAADDVAIFQDLTGKRPLAILATDKQLGLLVYDSEGKRRYVDSSGHINNVDIREVAGNRILLGCSNRSENAIRFFEYLPERYALRSIPAALPATEIQEVYGFCLYQGNDQLSAFVVGKEGLLEAYALLWEADDSLYAKKSFSHRFPGQCEGMVADDVRGFLYVAEEDRGIWRLDLNSPEPAPSLVVSIAAQPFLKADLEGLALFRWEGKPYLMVSSQGNHSFSIYAAEDSLQRVSTFQIAGFGRIDRVTETDGMEISPGEEGLLVVQDGRNTRNGWRRENQNFKVLRNAAWLSLLKFKK